MTLGSVQPQVEVLGVGGGGVRANLARMLEYLGGRPERWRPHVKTVKIPEVFQAGVGVRCFKCATTREARELCSALTADAVPHTDVLVAYPHREPALGELAAIARAHPWSASPCCPRNSHSFAHPIEAFVWTPSTGMVGIGVLPGATTSIANDVSLDGLVVVGDSFVHTTGSQEAFRWTAAGGMASIGRIGEHTYATATSENGSVVVGWATFSNVPYPYRWSPQTGGVLLGITNGFAHDVSPDGKTIVGNSGGEAFRWTRASGRVGLGDLPGGSLVGAALAVNATGSMIVGQGRTAAGDEAAVWPNFALSPVRMRDYLTSLGVTSHLGWTLTYCQDVSPDGRRIVGMGKNPSGQNQAWLVVLPDPWSTYCAAKINSLGCAPSIAGDGLPSATNAWTFHVRATNVRNQKPGVFLYKVGGTPNAQPFQGGTLCVGPGGIRRTVGLNAGGTPPPGSDCSGLYALDFNAFAAGLAGGNPDPALRTPGETYRVQAWGRDPGVAPPNDTTLSNALAVPIGP